MLVSEHGIKILFPDRIPLQYSKLQQKKWNFYRCTGRQNHIISSTNNWLISNHNQITSRDSFAFIIWVPNCKGRGKTIIRRLFQHKFICSRSSSPFNFKSSCFAIKVILNPFPLCNNVYVRPKQKTSLIINVTYCIHRC